jgi:hypothetical protein
MNSAPQGSPSESNSVFAYVTLRLPILRLRMMHFLGCGDSLGARTITSVPSCRALTSAWLSSSGKGRQTFAGLSYQLATTGFCAISERFSAVSFIRSQPSNVAVLIDPVNSTTKRPMEVVRLPVVRKTGVDGDRNPSAIKAEIHREVRIAVASALP